VLLRDVDTVEQLGPLVISLITDRTALERLRTAIAGLGTHNAAEAIAAEVIRLARA
jgi:UDP-N-acetylglucosamine:LPS N-acetylglucosamine transferase